MKTATAIIGFHLHKFVAETSTSHQTLTRRVRESWARRFPDSHAIEWSNHPDTYEQVEADAQKLARMLPGGPVRMPLDLLPCLLDALPEDRRAAALADLAALLGIILGTNPEQPATATFGALIRESGETIEALSRLFADGQLTASDDVAGALRQLREQQGGIASMIAVLEGRVVPASPHASAH